MTKTEFIQKYGDVRVNFHGYYKFQFTFHGQTGDGRLVAVYVGENSDDIYGLEVVADCSERIQDLEHDSGIIAGVVYENGVPVDSF